MYPYQEQILLDILQYKSLYWPLDLRRSGEKHLRREFARYKITMENIFSADNARVVAFD